MITGNRLAMLRSSLLTKGALILAFAIVVLTWLQISGLKHEVAELRASLREQKADSLATTHSASRSVATFSPSLAPSAPVIDGDLFALQRRVDALESDLNEAIDSLNRTVDELNRMNAVARKARQPGWTAAQASGPPDTNSSGDHPTAWAAAQQDGGMEWLRAQFETPVDIAQIRVRETDHPGAIVKVSAILEDGREVVVWRGAEAVGLSAPYDAAFNATAGIKARAVQIELDTSKSPGWEEIDAIELVGRDGSRQWATSVDASSSYGTRSTGLTLENGADAFWQLAR
jgi:hypothetical protein